MSRRLRMRVPLARVRQRAQRHRVRAERNRRRNDRYRVSDEEEAGVEQWNKGYMARGRAELRL